MEKILKLNLLAKVAIAILLGSILGSIFPEFISRIFISFNTLFGSFLSFIIPLIIIGLIIPGIAEMGNKSGRLLLITVGIAYGFTIFSAYFSYFASTLCFDYLVDFSQKISGDLDKSKSLTPYFSLNIPPAIDIMSALVLSFIMGLGIAFTKAKSLLSVSIEFKEIINLVISKLIIPLLPIFIFGIFLNLSYTGEINQMLGIFLKLILFIFGISIVVLILQYFIAWLVTKKNPFESLKNMLTAYFTALGTQSSAATIPVTLEQTIKNGVKKELADFVIPLCATIHLSGSILKITACAIAIMKFNAMEVNLAIFTPFILLLAISMIAAPGVPGGAIMAALAILSSSLGFGEEQQALMIALYITMDSFGTATNVTGDGAIALIVDKASKEKE